MYQWKKDCSFPYSKDGRKHTWQFISKLSASSRSLKFGLRTFFCRMKACLLTQLYANRFVSASLRFLRWSILELNLFRLVCCAWWEKAKLKKKLAARTPGFQKHAKRGFEIAYPTLFPSWISTPWKHEISLPLVILIPASRPSFELKSWISQRKNA